MTRKRYLKPGALTLPLTLSFLLLIFLLSAGAPLAAAHPTRSQETKPAEQISLQRFQAAQDALIKGKWLYIRSNIKKHLTRAIELLNNAVETFPQMADAHYYLSLLYFKKQDDQQALFHIKKAIENFEDIKKIYRFIRQKNPQLVDREYTGYGTKNLARYFAARGNIYWKMKKYNEARAQYLIALHRDPGIEELYPKLVRLYFQEESYQKALRYLTLAETKNIKINPRLKRKVYNAVTNPRAAKRRKYNAGLYLKLRLGQGMMDGGDYGRITEASQNYYGGLIERYNWDNITMSGGTVFKEQAAEIGYLFKKWGFALEWGRISRNFRVENAIYQYHARQEGIWDREFIAVPFLLNVYYRILHVSPGKSLFSKPFSIDAVILAGAGLYKGTYKENYDQQDIGAFSIFHDYSDESKQNTIGFHAGAAVEFNITSHWTLFVETRYRFVSFKNMYGRGVYTSSSSRFDYQGELYYVTDEYYNRSFFNLGPTGDLRHTEQKAELNLNGFSLNVGIRFNL
jgi:tetratricopeptide (TPR) repeat protein